MKNLIGGSKLYPVGVLVFSKGEIIITSGNRQHVYESGSCPTSDCILNTCNKIPRLPYMQSHWIKWWYDDPLGLTFIMIVKLHSGFFKAFFADT